MWNNTLVVPSTLAATVAASLYWFYSNYLQSKKAIKCPKGTSIDRQGIPVKGRPGVYKSGLLVDDDVDIIDKFYPGVNTVYDMFMRGYGISTNEPCLGTRGKDGKYHFKTYDQVLQRSKALASALVNHFGLEPVNTTNIGIYAKNSEEWTEAALAAVQQSFVIVPLYDTLGADAASYIIKQADISLIFVDSIDKAHKLIDKKAELPTLKYIVLVAGTPSNEDLIKASAAEIELVTFDKAVEIGKQNPADLHLPKEEDTFIICYTSGTTGTPKGVVISHKNTVANLSGWLYHLSTFHPEEISPDQIHISYLPLSHMLEQMAHWNFLSYGARIGYISGNIQTLMGDIQELKPTGFPAVPRLLNRLYDAIQVNVQKAGFVGRSIYNIAYRKKLAMIKKGIFTRDTIWDRLVFKKIQQQLGGHVRFMATGSAPISAQVLETCRVATGALILEGYGQTENTALATMTWPTDWTGGHCGGPAPCSLVKLADVPELNYFAKDGKGEIMLAGPSVVSGYYKDPERTSELFDEDGFLHTGDIGQMNPNGTIKIIDRKKHIFKLAQGEYVAPEKIENVYVRTPVVQQVYVDGDSLERWLIAIVVPEPQVIEAWNAEHGTPGRSLDEICKDPKAHDFVLSELQKIGKENKLNSIEQVKKIHLTSEAFTVENGLLTPTLKAKRPQLRLVYKDTMTRIYKENPTL